MIRAFKYVLLPNRAQERTLAYWLERCRELYNAALEERKQAWELRRISITRYDQHAELTDVRADDPDWWAVPLSVERSALQRIDHAFKAFFRRVKAGEKKLGYPRFKGKGWYDSFSIGRVAVNGQHVQVPKLGAVRFKKYRPIRGEVRDVVIRRGVGRWHVSFVCDLGAAPEKVAVKSAVGIDLGLKSFVALSTGELVENPRPYRESERRLGIAQRALATKKRGSNSCQRARNHVSRIHEKIKNQRLDFHRKLASRLFSRFDLIAHEDLNVKGLARGRLAKSVQDASWSQFLRCLAFKAESAGRWLVPVDPRGTSQRCSACGEVVPKALVDRVHKCRCGYTANRDVNAARNVFALGQSAVGSARMATLVSP